MGPLKQSLEENISLQRSNCSILGLTVTVALFAKEVPAIFSDLACSSGHVLSKTKSVTPHFLLAFLAKVDPTFLPSKFQKICMWEHFGRERS